jgi:hypothetical protein
VAGRAAVAVVDGLEVGGRPAVEAGAGHGANRRGASARVDTFGPLARITSQGGDDDYGLGEGTALPARPKHPNKDFEALLREAELRHWAVWRDARYFKCRCPCDEKHYVGVVLTPSGSRTLINTRKRFERLPCWKEVGL